MFRTLSASLTVLLLVGCAGGPHAGGPAGGPRPAEEERPRGERQAPPPPLTPAQRAALRVERLRLSAEEITLQVGDTARVEVVALDSAGAEVAEAQIGRFVRGDAAFYRPEEGVVEAVEPGEAVLVAFVSKPERGGRRPDPVRGQTRIVVRPLPVARVEIEAPEGPLYADTRLRLDARAYSEAGLREDAVLAWRTSDPEVARVTEHGLVRLLRPGSVTLTAESEGVRATTRLEVRSNPVRGLEVTVPEEEPRVGRVLHLEAVARDGRGEAVPDVPVDWSAAGPLGSVVDGAQMDPTGRFVADRPGLYEVTASVGSRSAVAEIAVSPGPYRRKMSKVGHAAVTQRTTSDLWVFEGVDGKDYAYTGTHAEGKGGNVMYAWNVTDPTKPLLTDSVVVDARVVNDVKINEARTLAVITREGASDRRNGIVILDIQIPAHPRIVSSFTENLTAGVHNVWIEGEVVYAVNDGTRALHIVDISDPAAPRHAGRWQLEKENRYLHDVMVKDGLAYLSYWDDGLVILDVGAGIEGGTPTEPAFVSQYSYDARHGAETYGNTHHAYPYGDYVFLGDEIFGCSECVNGPRGYVHVVDVSRIREPKEVAWYRVPEAGTHNLWVEDDKLYVAYYQGGVRVVDVSGTLRGDLYRQGREIGWYMTEAGPGKSFRPNDTMAWGPQPFKGHVFATDMHSGLWILELEERGEEE